MAKSDLELGAFVEATGDSLALAQQGITGEELASTTMAVAEATLEAKVGLGVDSDGRVRVQPLGRAELAAVTSAQSVSTVTVNFVALADQDAPVATAPPLIDRDKAIDKLAGQSDVKRLGEIFGPLRFDATLVPERSTWLVRAIDETGRTVREQLIGKET